MYRAVVPKRSGVHRFACLALYRALLRQCPPSNNSPPWLTEARYLVKQKFRKYKLLQSPSQVANALKAGYKTLDLLDSAANGNLQDAHQLSSILAQAKSIKQQYAMQQKQRAEELERSRPPLSQKQARKAESIRFQEETRRRHPNTPSIFQYPQRPVTKRRVPVLVNARGVPFLRIKKPQPQNLSGTIRAILDKRWRRIEMRERLRTELLFAKDEDAWDRMTKNVEECKWTEEVEDALRDVCVKIDESDRKNRAVAEGMWRIVLTEREKVKEQENLKPCVD